jgi:hypothetical protein
MVSSASMARTSALPCSRTLSATFICTLPT